MTGMPLRTRLFTTALDRLGRGSIVDMDLDDIQRARRSVAPTVPPFSWVTGRVARSVTIGTDSLAARDGHSLPVRVYRPSTATRDLPVVVFFHGGGWVLGSTRMYDRPLLVPRRGGGRGGAQRRLPDGARAPGPDRGPGLRRRRPAGVGATASAGAPTPPASPSPADSAGGNLAAVVCQVVRDDGGPVIAHQALIYPGTDATMSQPSIRQHADAPVLTRPKIEAFLAHYRGPDGLATQDPLLSPLWAADHSGLPPALVQTADLDPLRDEGALYATRLSDAGVPVRLTNYLGAPHGFASFPGATPIAAQARAELVGELRSHLG